MKGGQVNGIRVLVVGGSGFVGRHLMNYFSSQGTSQSGEAGFIRMDIRDPETTRNVLKQIAPDLVINASGMTNVDYCESHGEDAISINAYSVGMLANAAEECGAKLCHISTDYVFSGEKGNYSEDDDTGPINAYGRSKLMAEKELQGRKCIIIRISTPYGVNLSGKKVTFMDFVISSLRSGKKVRIVTDQYTTPTYTGDIPVTIGRLFSLNKTGIYHLGSTECISRHSFAELLADVFSLDSDLIEPVKTTEMGFAAKRPLNTCMNVSKISEIIELNSIRKNLEVIRESRQ